MVSKENTELQQQIKIPEELSADEKWIVRIKGVDQGPFSSRDLYPKLLTGEIDPETMLIDQDSFTRHRLKDIDELKKYLHLHNTLNPILLEEKKQQEREEYWKTKGRKLVILSIVGVITLIFAGWAVWRVFIYKPQDIYLAEGDYLFSATPFRKQEGQKKRRKYWYWKPSRKSSGKRGNKGNQKGEGPKGSVIDFAEGGGSAIPKAKLEKAISRRISQIFSCFKGQLERDSSFEGGEVEFTIQGSTGKVINAKMADNPNLRILNKCIKRVTSRWTMPTFQGNAVIYFPVYIRKR